MGIKKRETNGRIRAKARSKDALRGNFEQWHFIIRISWFILIISNDLIYDFRPTLRCCGCEGFDGRTRNPFVIMAEARGSKYIYIPKLLAVDSERLKDSVWATKKKTKNVEKKGPKQLQIRITKRTPTTTTTTRIRTRTWRKIYRQSRNNN